MTTATPARRRRLRSRGSGYRRGLVAAVTAAAAAAVVGVVAPATAATPACSSVMFVGARGSGEALDDHAGLGATVSWLKSEMDKRLRAAGRPVMAMSAVRYPAEDVRVLIPSAQVQDLAARAAAAAAVRNPSAAVLLAQAYQRYQSQSLTPFMDGLDIGVESAYAYLLNRSATCPQEHYVLAGYSQGAMVMHRVLNRIADQGLTGLLGRIDGVGLVADGDKVAHTAALVLGGGGLGVGVAAHPLIRTIAHRPSQFPNRDVPATVVGRTANACRVTDAVCDFDLATLISDKATSELQVHLSYVGTQAVTDTAVFLAAQVLRRSPAPPPPSGPEIEVTASPVVNGRWDLTMRSIVPCPAGSTGVDFFAVDWDGFAYVVPDSAGRWYMSQPGFPAPPNDWTLRVTCLGDQGTHLKQYQDITLHVQ